MSVQLLNPQTPRARRRRGVILLAVLVVLVILSLAAYQYSDMMLSEYRAAENAHRMMQARAIADSGVHYAAAMLMSPDTVNNTLGGNVSNNAQYFLDVQVPTGDGSGNFGKFTLVAPMDPYAGQTGYAYGVVDEGAKLNVNVLMQLDPTGTVLYNALMQLPNMTSNIAYAIVDWLDTDDVPSPGGAEDDTYMGMNPPYHCKNGPIESIEELLMVQGVTPYLLFGNDKNRNGVIDPDEDNSDGSGIGWSAFLTMCSREQNSDTSGNPYLYLNSTDIQDLYNGLTTQVDPNLAAFIILARQYGMTTMSGSGNGSGSTGSTKGSSANSSSSASTDLSGVTIDFTNVPSTKNNITSMWALVNAQITVPGSNGQASTTYASPLSDPNQQTNLLPLLFSVCTLSPSNEIPARVNINTCPQEVLNALQGILNPGTSATSSSPNASTSGSTTSSTTTSSSSSSSSNNGSTVAGTLVTVFSQTELDSILSTRPSYTSGNAPDASFATPAWLYLQAGVSVQTLQALEPYITGRSQVYRVQSVGYIDDNGPSVRVEAIIDTNGGRPRIISYRDLTALGKGFTRTQ